MRRVPAAARRVHHCVAITPRGGIETMRITIVTVWMLLALGGMAAAAKPCRHLCLDAIRACVTETRSMISCTGLRGTEKRDCRRTRRAALHACKGRDGVILAACRMRPTLPTCSPSGAFLDAR
jgi:hypothetical protein